MDAVLRSLHHLSSMTKVAIGPKLLASGLALAEQRGAGNTLLRSPGVMKHYNLDFTERAMKNMHRHGDVNGLATELAGARRTVVDARRAAEKMRAVRPTVQKAPRT
jgi:hypothetical protein